MLVLGKNLLNGKQILSLRISRPIATVLEPIINPNNLKLEGWFVETINEKHRLILLSSEVRDIFPQGIVVNDLDALSEPHDLVRLKPVIDLNFKLINKVVVDTGKKRLGKVEDYAFEKVGFFIQKLYVAQPLIKSFSGGGLVIDRSQIVNITHKKITVNQPTVTEGKSMPVPSAAQ